MKCPEGDPRGLRPTRGASGPLILDSGRRARANLARTFDASASRFRAIAQKARRRRFITLSFDFASDLRVGSHLIVQRVLAPVDHREIQVSVFIRFFYLRVRSDEKGLPQEMASVYTRAVCFDGAEPTRTRRSRLSTWPEWKTGLRCVRGHMTGPPPVWPTSSLGCAAAGRPGRCAVKLGGRAHGERDER